MDDYFKNHQIEHEENLPLPYVDYQPHFFWILKFSKEENSQQYVCKCFKTSIENYWNIQIKSWENYGKNGWEIGYKEGRLGLVNMLYYKQYKDGYLYKDKICHRCNGGILPNIVSESRNKTLNLYWYKMRVMYSNHSELSSFDEIGKYNKEIEDIQSMINKYTPIEYKEGRNTNSLSNDSLNSNYNRELWKKQYELQKKQDKIERKLDKIFENHIRKDFQLKLVGEMWVNETLIFKLCKQMFPKDNVIHHHRPKELEGLELDIFLENMKIGIEYMGKQHYKPIKHFGGTKSLEKTKERDKRKMELCKNLGIKLIHITYKETVSKNLIKTKILEISEQS